MSMTEFTIGCSKTINLGNYQSLRIESSVTFTVEKGDSIAGLKAEAQKQLKALLQETYQSQYKLSESANGRN